MNYTKNHHLPQWVSSDRVRMEDFNDAMASIESGLDAADAAQDAADAALAKANAAYAPGNKPFVVGSYTGDNARSKIIDLGFKPSFVIVSGMTQTTDENDPTGSCPFFAITADSTNVRCRVQLVSVGFAVYYSGNYSYLYPDLNEKGRHYDYIAFR